MTSQHVAGPTHAAAGLACDAVVAVCRRVRRDDRSSPVARALARAVHQHAVLTYVRSCSAAGANLTFADCKHELAERNWLDILPSLQRITASVLPGFESCTAARILSSIADEMRVVARDTDASRTLNAIWRDVFACYSGHLIQWLNFGTVHDASGDFFVCRNVDSSSVSENAGMPPGHTFRIAYDRLPNFVSREIADSIYFAGQVVNCILRFDVDCTSIEPTRELPASPGAEEEKLPIVLEGSILGSRKGGARCVEATILEMQRNGASVGLSVEAASLLWREAASSRMSRLMPHSSIGLYLRSLRDFLLLGNEQFWRSFFSQLHTMRHILEIDAGALDVAAAERCIEHIVDTALADCNSSSQIPCILHFTVEADGQLSPYFDLPFPASAVIASTAGKYNQIFAVTFGVRGVVHSLERCYRSIAQVLRRRLSRASASSADRCTSDRRRTLIKQCALLRMRMSRFMQAFDDYLQVDVFETGFLSLMEQIGNAGDTSSTPSVPFDDIASAHTGVMERWLLESFADSDALLRRLHALFDACYGLCDYTESIIDGTIESALQGHRCEAAFNRNIELLVRMLSGLQGRIGGSKVGVLLMKIDWDSFYLDSVYSNGCGRQIFAHN